MYHPAIARLKKVFTERREVCRDRYAKALPEREYMQNVGAERELIEILNRLDAELQKPETPDDE